MAVNYARVPKKRPKLCAKTIRERNDNRCQYTGTLLRPDEGSLDHVLPHSRVGKDRRLPTHARDRHPDVAGDKPPQCTRPLLQIDLLHRGAMISACPRFRLCLLCCLLSMRWAQV